MIDHTGFRRVLIACSVTHTAASAIAPYRHYRKVYKLYHYFTNFGQPQPPPAYRGFSFIIIDMIIDGMPMTAYQKRRHKVAGCRHGRGRRVPRGEPPHY